jgi:IS5 family transposase
MQTQMSFAELEYISKKKLTRRERFLAQIEAATPWAQLVAVIEPHYPKGNRGRPRIGLERMIKMYIAQKGFGLSDEGIEDALYDSQAIRRFVGIDLGREATPDATKPQAPSPARRPQPHGRDLEASCVSFFL